MAAHFEPVMNDLVTPPPTRRTATGGYPRVAFYDMLGKPLLRRLVIKSMQFRRA